MGMQQTYGGVTRAIAPVLYGRAFDTLGVSSPYYFSSAIILATIFLGFGLDKYARHEVAQPKADAQPELIAEPLDPATETQLAAKAAAATERES
jgi:hypothetical protein